MSTGENTQKPQLFAFDDNQNKLSDKGCNRARPPGAFFVIVDE